jgi:hypothetical protein
VTTGEQTAQQEFEAGSESDYVAVVGGGDHVAERPSPAVEIVQHGQSTRYNSIFYNFELWAQGLQPANRPLVPASARDEKCHDVSLHERNSLRCYEKLITPGAQTGRRGDTGPVRVLLAADTHRPIFPSRSRL